MPKRERDNRLRPSPTQRRRWANLPGMAPHPDFVQAARDSWTGLPAEYRHVAPDAVQTLRDAARERYLTVWTADPAEPAPGRLHLNRYTMTAAQTIEYIAGCASGRWIEEVLLIEPSDGPPADVEASDG
ncbi:MAG: hypothetical protein ACYDCQ_04580 [Dehalococcoidia bacterium]